MEPKAFPAGRPRPWYQPPAPPQAWTSRTAPIAPSASHSAVRRCPSAERPWLPIWVATPVSFATRASRRASQMSCVSGFSQ